MSVEIVTKEDLRGFEIRLIKVIETLISKQDSVISVRPEGYKTSDVRKILGCSVNKLVSLRVSRNIRTKKIGGTLYYNPEDIRKLVEEGY